MRIRTIKPEFFVHDGLFDAEMEAKLPLRLSFAGLWCCADREGRFKWEPRRLGAQILPYDCIDFSRVLDALVTRGFVVKYGSYGAIPSWKRHQVVNHRERQSVLPPPPKNLADFEDSSEGNADACATRGSRVTVTHGGKGREGKGKERNIIAPAEAVAGELLFDKPETAAGWDIGNETGPNGENAKESVLSPVDEPDHVRVEAPPVKTPIKPKDELFEALCRETNIEWQTLTQIGRGAANKALAQIRQASPEVTPEMIRIRVSNLKDMFPKATVTPMSLAKYWAAAAYEPGQLPAKIQADRERRKAAYSA